MVADRRLFFLRHGLADRGAYLGDDDDLRPLTEEGRLRMHAQARYIAGLATGIELVLSSPLTRALETAEIVAARLGLADGLRVEPRLGPGFDLPALAAVLEGPGADHGRLMLVGHEPGFSEVVGELIGSGEVVLKKGGLARVDLLPGRRPRGRLVWLLQPRTMLSGDHAPGDGGPAAG